MRIFEMKANRVEKPLGFFMEPLRLTWKVDETESKIQKAARVVISKTADYSDIVSDSGMTADIDSLCFAPEISLEARTRYYWKVEVEGDLGDVGAGESWFETGKAGEDWSGKWITSDLRQNMYLEKKFSVEKPVARARAYVAAMGVYELYMNEVKSGDEYLAPFCNAYDKWQQAETYDVTPQLRAGENTVRFMLGGGWAVSRFGLGQHGENGFKGLYADHESLLCEIIVEYEDGTAAVIPSDETWIARESAVRDSSIYDGETYDATFDTSKEFPVKIDDTLGYDKLMDRLSVPVRITERIKPVEIIITPKNERIIDLGQEITGWFEFVCREPKGAKVKLYYFEVMQDGCYYRENLRSAVCEYTYISDGVARAVRPFHTFYGFRYIMVEGVSDIKLEDFTGCAVHSDIDRTGFIETSNPKVNRLALNALWGQRDNFLDVPTDCPQRDERLGWTGDAQAFSGTACFNMDSAAFFQKYLYDMLQEQNERGGSVPHVVPACGMKGEGGSCAWADAATIIPWNVYMFYGDKELLKQTYPNMVGWVEWIKKTEEAAGSGRLWNTGFHFADWLALDTKNNSVMGGTDPFFVATAYYYYSTSLLVKAAKALGYDDDAKKYGKLLDEIYAAIQKEYFTPNGLMAQTTQTAYVCALFMGFAPEEHKARLAKLLEAELAATDGKLRTGFVGTAYLNRALSANGLNKRAYQLLLNEEYPGWLYEVNLGATTVWERWNSLLPDGKISDTGMNSLNHYAYGAIMEWVYRDVAGINPCECAPGFKKAVLAPKPHYSLPKVSVKYNSAMGWYESAWEIEKNLFTWNVKIPFGASAIAVFPNGDKEALAKAHPGIEFNVCKKGNVYAELPAGEYCFKYKPAQPLHRIISLDMQVSEIMTIPEACEAIFSELPMLKRFANNGGPDRFGSAPLRNMLTGNFMMRIPEEKVRAIEEKLEALN